MSGIGPAMDMTMETARDGRAVVPAAVSNPNASAATAPVHDARASQAATGPAPKPGRTGPSTTRVETRSPDAVTDVPMAASVPAAVGTGIGVDAGAPQAMASADAVADGAATDTLAAATRPATDVAVAAHPVPARTFATTQAAARPAPAASPADAGSLGGTVFALLLVVGLILGLGWLARRMPGFGRGASGNGLRMVASLPIGARERVVVVEVGNTQLLLGVGPGGTRTLHTLERPLPESAPAQAPQFAQLLAQHFGKKV